jgi:hypothetical protein
MSIQKIKDHLDFFKHINSLPFRTLSLDLILGFSKYLPFGRLHIQESEKPRSYVWFHIVERQHGNQRQPDRIELPTPDRPQASTSIDSSFIASDGRPVGELTVYDG